MRILVLRSLVFAALFFVTAGTAQIQNSGEVLCNFFPPNQMRFPVRNDGKQMTYGQFKKILEATEAVYKPQFAALGLGNFNVVDRWTDDSVNACASISVPCSILRQHPELSETKPQERYVEIYGGLARHPYLTSEALMVVICHEIGHHLGGYPRYNNGASQMSTEGQADYFATAKCARAIYEKISPKSNQNWIWANSKRLPQEVKNACLTNFAPTSEEAIFCARSSMAGLSLAQVLGTTANGALPNVGFLNKDRSVVPATFEGHSKAQCRLDTYFAGAVCHVSHNVAFSPTSASQGACIDPKQDGTRPACWYKAPANDHQVFNGIAF